MKNMWEVSWSQSIGNIDFETTCLLEAVSATDAVTKFIQLFTTSADNLNWEKQIFRAEKNHTFFLFRYENGSLRRV